MIRGRKTFICRDCGNSFEHLDIEWRATVLSQPAKCPQCGSYRTRPRVATDVVLKRIADAPYKSVWEEMAGVTSDT
jgi:DNA-directed RNA polymerase subunit RPC12/RpoP